MDTEDRPPFKQSVDQFRRAFGMDLKSAVDRVQSEYSSFKARNQALIERQNDRSNAAQVQMISHFALLATLTLTTVGFLITQTVQSLTPAHKWVILIIMALEALLYPCTNNGHVVSFEAAV